MNSTSPTGPPTAASGFLPPLEGLRALAALGVLTTHVAFLTGTSTGSPIARVWGRFDLWVAVFFALSGFLLWRGVARAARSESVAPRRARPYYRSRIVRIMPAYLVLAVAALVVLPENVDLGVREWVANLALLQVYVPGALVSGLTHAWSLSVEATFYLVLPALWLALRPLSGRAARWRAPLVLAVAALSLAWAYVPFHEALGLPEEVNTHTLPPAFAAWFAAGMLLAEVVVAPPRLLLRLHAAPWSRWVWWSLAVVVFLTTTSTTLYAEGFVQATPAEFAGRTASGAVIAWCLLAPVVLASPSARFPVLASRPMLALGRWSYGIFLWHVLVLQLLFSPLGVPMFGGHMATMWVATVIVSIAVAAASYGWIEEPARRALGQSRLRAFVPGETVVRADAPDESAPAGSDYSGPSPLGASASEAPEPGSASPGPSGSATPGAPSGSASSAPRA